MKISGSKILVTGGAGFIGSHIVESLVRRGARVTVFDNLSSGSRDNLAAVAGDVEVIVGDVLDADAVGAAARGKQAISHQAAQLEITRALDDPLWDLRVNTIGTLNVLAAATAAGVERVVNASSACVYGQAENVPESEDHPTNPNWAYGVSKLAAEKYARILGEAHGVGVTSLRYAIVYGEREWYGRVLTIFLKRALGGKLPVVFGEGDQERDFTYVGDAVALHQLCLEQAAAVGEVFNASTGVATTIRALAAEVIAATGLDGEPIHEQVAVGERSQEVEENRLRLPAELQQMVLSTAKAERLLGWRPGTALPEGLRREWSWLREHPERWQRMSY